MRDGMNLQDNRDALVTAALPHAAFDGWSAASLAAAAQDLGGDATLPARAFPGGPADAVAHFVDYADRLMADDLAACNVASLRTGERVFTAVKLRLERWSANREAIRRALSLLSLPANLPLAVRLAWGTADAVWNAVGDAAHDFSWYTKRSTLAAVYSATLLYWLEDASEDSADSWEFLRRRLADAQRVPNLRAWLEDGFHNLPGLRLPKAARRWGIPGASDQIGRPASSSRRPAASSRTSSR
jgi:ubiquinone biosynthesis protein COQ9